MSLYKKNKDGWAPVFQNNENKLFIPASITKSLTTAGLFEIHGMNSVIATKIFASKKPSKGVLNGDVYIKGYGDPTLVSEKLWLLVNELSKWGVKEIKGDLVFDDTAFDRNLLDGDRTPWNQRAYNSALSGLSLNWNSVRVRFLDAKTLNVTVDPKNPYFEIRPKKHFKKSSQVDIRDYKTKEVLSVFFGKDAMEKEKSIYRRVFKPRKYFATQFENMLKKEGVKVSGNVEWGKTPENLIEIGKIESAPMSQMAKLMMKFSNNFIADMLTKNTAHLATGKAGTYDEGLKALEKSFKDVSPFKNGVVYKSASGLSRKNKISPADFTRFMIDLQSKVYFPEFLSSLPISCVDGTLKKRICKAKGLVRAKTGLLAGVAALSGYYKNPQTLEEYTFTFVFNGSNGQQFDAKKTFDTFLEKI